MELHAALSALRSGWWIAVVGAVVGGTVALVLSLVQTPLYSSSTQLFVSTQNLTSTSEILQGSQFSQQRVTSYVRLLNGDELAGRVIQRLDLELTPAELQNQIAAAAVTDTVLIEVTVIDPSPAQAQAIARAVGAEFTTWVAELEAPAEGGRSPVRVTVSEPPGRASAPTTPQTEQNVVLGLIAGILVGAGVVLLRALLDRTVKDPEEAAELAAAPVIGMVLRDSGLEKHHIFTDVSGGGRAAEDYRQLRTNLQFLKVDDPPRVVMITSPLPSEGKTTVAINLGLALSDAGKTVTVIEADMRRPKVTRYLGLVSGSGLTSVLTGSAEVSDVLQRYRDGFSVIAAGPIPPNPGELLASHQMAQLLKELRSTNDFVLVDAPPLLPVADASGLAVHMDGVLISIRHGSTHKDQLRQAATTLDRVGAELLGVVLNIVPPKAHATTAYGYAYSYDRPSA